VKCVKTAPRRIILESANPAYPPREFDAESPAVTVLGKVVAILRRD
jgi:SOS-response transcriptional repressor LexA